MMVILDILINWMLHEVGYISKIYRNNGNNTFTEQTSISLTGCMIVVQ